jgi:hypothetical protein
MEESMNLSKPFSYVFEDKQWITKLGLGALITLVPVLNFAWQGYMVGILRNMMKNSPEPLPNWDDLGKKLTDGLILFGAQLVYSLPMLIVVCLPLGIMVVPALLSGNSDFDDLSQAIAGVGSLLFLCLLCAFLVYSLILSVIFPAIMVLFAREGTFAACFKFREAFDLISRYASQFFTAWGVSIGGGLLIGFAVGLVSGFLSLIPCLGQLASLVLSVGIGLYISSVYCHLFGQFGNFAFGQDQPAA